MIIDFLLKTLEPKLKRNRDKVVQTRYDKELNNLIAEAKSKGIDLKDDPELTKKSKEILKKMKIDSFKFRDGDSWVL